MLWSIKFSFSNRFLVLFKRILTFAQRQVDCFDVFLHAEFRQPKMMFNQTQHHIALPCKKISTCWLTESVCEQVAALLLSPLTLPYQRPVTFVCFRLPHARSPHNEGRPNFFLFFVQIAAAASFVISVYSANTHTSKHRVVSLLMDLFDWLLSERKGCTFQQFPEVCCFFFSSV